jgi:hypothetical protein
VAKGVIGGWEINEVGIHSEGSVIDNNEIYPLGTVGMYKGQRWTGISLIKEGDSPVRFYAGATQSTNE